MASLIARKGHGRNRSKVYYSIQYWIAGSPRRKSLHTTSLQVAKEKLRQFESERARGNACPLPTRTPIPNVVAAYVQHIKLTKTASSVRSDTWYLREIFGPVCEALELPNNDRVHEHLLADCLENITTAQVADFIACKVRSHGYAPKTANRYREILQRLFNWAMKQYGVRMPNQTNPAASVERYRERARTIRFLTIEQIDEQLRALDSEPLLRTMVAVCIYAGLRRAEVLKDIDLKKGPYGTLYVREKTVKEEFWQPKTKVNRIVPISASLRHYLDVYTPRIVPGHWFLPSPNGHRWDPDNFSQALRRANKRAALPWNCLDYRHTFGSHLAMVGEPLHKIAELMGNSPEICRKHYVNLMPDSLHESVDFRREAQTRG